MIRITKKHRTCNDSPCMLVFVQERQFGLYVVGARSGGVRVSTNASLRESKYNTRDINYALRIAVP